MAYAHRALNSFAALPFISTWKTDNLSTGSSTDTQVKLPLVATGTYKFTVNWGDGNSDAITTWNQAQVTHTYAAIGTYTITITGFIKGWSFGPETPVPPSTGDRLKLLTITQFGCLKFTDAPFAFHGCYNLTLTGVTDIPNFRGITDAHGFFRLCNSITTIPNVNKWDVSKIQNFRRFFSGCNRFNSNVGNWNVSKATNFSALFFGNQSITEPLLGGVFNNGGSDSIKNWDTSNVTDMTSTFYAQPAFNQEVGLWDVSNVTNFSSMLNSYWNNGLGADLGTFNNGGSDSIKNWDTSSAVNMNGLFSGQPLFNQNISEWYTSNVTNMGYMFQSRYFNNGGSPDINNWDTSKVTNMSRMLQGAFAFDQPINNWNVSLVTDFINFMSSSGLPNAYSVTNYSNLLIGWASRPVQPNRSINFSTNKYNSTAVAARAILTSAPNNWTIADGGLQP